VWGDLRLGFGVCLPSAHFLAQLIHCLRLDLSSFVK
jgi:hypothetical protein